MRLSEREKTILETLVELYVRDAGPVSSLQLQKELDLELSTASIRNVLHGLEEKGLLHQPHTSAGRVPTRDGYRAYVDHFWLPLDATRAQQGIPADHIKLTHTNLNGPAAITMLLPVIQLMGQLKIDVLKAVTE